jgi:SH3-like domain-containing protein
LQEINCNPIIQTFTTNALGNKKILHKMSEKAAFVKKMFHHWCKMIMQAIIPWLSVRCLWMSYKQET